MPSFVVRPTCSAAYKLVLVSTGLADATWTLSPKNEWDIAAAVALVNSRGGFLQSVGDSPLTLSHGGGNIPLVLGRECPGGVG